MVFPCVHFLNRNHPGYNDIFHSRMSVNMKKTTITFISFRNLVDSHSFSKHFDNNFIQGISWGISFYSIFTQESNKSNENVFPIKWLRQKTLTMTKIHFFMRTYNCEYFLQQSGGFLPLYPSQLFKIDFCSSQICY